MVLASKVFWLGGGEAELSPLLLCCCWLLVLNSLPALPQLLLHSPRVKVRRKRAVFQVSLVQKSSPQKLPESD